MTWVRLDRGYEITWVRVDVVQVDLGYELTVNRRRGLRVQTPEIMTKNWSVLQSVFSTHRFSDRSM